MFNCNDLDHCIILYSADTGLDDSEMDDNPVKKRKPGRPKRLEDCSTGTYFITYT